MNAITTTQILSIARKNHWWFRILGTSQPITQPVYRDGWWFIPKEQDKTIIPLNAIERVEELRKAGVPIARVIVAHEAPKVLPSPYVQPKPIQIPWKELGKGFAISISALTSALVAVFGALLPFLLFMPMILIDPAICIQLPSGLIVEVYSWVD